MAKKILLVEDDEMISSMYKTRMEQSGYEILTANNGNDGLSTALKEKPDIILLDIILPQMDGFSVLQELRGSKKTEKIPVFMLTNLGTEEDREKGKRLGANDYLVKASLTPADILHKIEEYIGPGKIEESNN